MGSKYHDGLNAYCLGVAGLGLRLTAGEGMDGM